MLDSGTLTTLKDIATICGVIVGAVSLVVAARNTGLTKRSNRARFWLDLRNMFADHDDVHRKLRPGGAWASAGSGPNTPEEWADVESYLGLFETCEDIIRARLIDLESFRRSYEYRIRNIVGNDRIRQEKLVSRGQYWARFNRLAGRLGVEVGLQK
jgi:hypothetical protein